MAQDLRNRRVKKSLNLELIIYQLLFKIFFEVNFT